MSYILNGVTPAMSSAKQDELIGGGPEKRAALRHTYYAGSLPAFRRYAAPLAGMTPMIMEYIA